MESLRSPLQALIVQWLVTAGDTVRRGDTVVVLEAMKMGHELRAPCDGRVHALLLPVGEQVQVDEVLATIEALPETLSNDADAHAPAPAPAPAPAQASVTAPMAGSPRADLQQVLDRHRYTLDEARPQAVARRHSQGQRTARENIADLCDDGSYIEYGALAVAAQRNRREEADLIANTPADGMVCGIGSVNGRIFGAEGGGPVVSRAVVMAYDATVLAGTQGLRNHEKTDRMLGIALAQKLPVVLFAEGGGGRPGDTDSTAVAGLHLGTFAAFARLSGQVPVIGIVNGRCFAGNAALLGCSDVVIATRNSNIGMGGPAMVEGGGAGCVSCGRDRTQCRTARQRCH